MLLPFKARYVPSGIGENSAFKIFRYRRANNSTSQPKKVFNDTTISAVIREGREMVKGSKKKKKGSKRYQ
jgi:hypothetical protein